ncbi:hypothetical protein EC991_005079 [Linnemannia zychae]|nr:hypothetical protein EC991_005079 [Linnemannia zychae]
MKLIFLIAALSVATVSALVVDNTPIVDVPIEELKGCNIATLQWNVVTQNTIYQFNTFTFRVEYANTPRDYVSTLMVPRMSDYELVTSCHEDGVWCVTHNGWKSSDAVTIHYAHQKFFHKSPQWRTPSFKATREDFHYWDCVKW